MYNSQFKLVSKTHRDGCCHFSAFDKKQLMDSYRTIVASSSRFKMKRVLLVELPTPKCFKCSTVSNRLHACLHCVTISCFSHLSLHDHNFALDILNSTIYCSKCKDYVYDMEFEHALSELKVNLDQELAAICDPGQKRFVFSGWKPSQEELTTIKSKSTVSCSHSGLRGMRNLGSTCFMNAILQTLIHNPPLRGYFLSDKHTRDTCVNDSKCLACQLDNLFSQFYAGIKNPFIPSEFLFAMWGSCSQLSGYLEQDAHEFFIAVLNVLHSNLTATVKNSSHLFGEPFSRVKQEDKNANKKSIVKDYIASVKKEKDGSANFDPHACGCIIHRIFAGKFQSTVTCLQCGNKTIAYDPFLDISLDFRPPGSYSGSPTVSSVSPESPSLYDCFAKFCQKESLSAKDYRCSKCRPKSNNESNNPGKGAEKQLSLKVVPFVLALQLKRFDHSSANGTNGSGDSNPLHSSQSKNTFSTPENGNNYRNEFSVSSQLGKLDKHISFPLELDLSPYATFSINPSPTKKSERPSSPPIKSPPSQTRSRVSSPTIRKQPSSPISSTSPTPKVLSSFTTSTEISIPSNPAYKYILFAVIVHLGTMHSGHYISYIRKTGSLGQWFRCDDSVITKVEWEEVRDSQAYMCFYLKKHIEYNE